MQNVTNVILMRRLVLARLRVLILLATAGLAWPAQVRAQLAAPAPRKAKQGYTAAQFLQAVLRADYVTAYRGLAPEVRKSITINDFETAAQPLWKRGQRQGTAIELYKLGVRLADGESPRYFYSFSFAADSSLKIPSALLEVTFRDTASRAVLAFGLRYPTAPPANKTKPSSKKPASNKKK